MTKTITLHVKQIIYTTGKEEITTLNNRQWSAIKKSKKIKQGTITINNLATLTIKIKTK